MQRKSPKKKPVPLGEPIEWTDDDLDALALVSETNIKEAEALWQNTAPPPCKGLIDAEIVEPEPDKK
uniref:Uncharacterized protein n=1 Tax=Thermosporothrix sp. COM3 TaxID=2490863 RepID=A0A455SP54_9CHLR|nr:hypothetical protein KTC_48990 [Thermosporothrix sp. COM3]BBH90213.1 hypothetical protein KTC_49640 [Thermosporothrix sp. COM3]BBH90278.1 hypothetical protein KTC_50290 [Thermosporothrix sp. COM3]